MKDMHPVKDIVFCRTSLGDKEEGKVIGLPKKGVTEEDPTYKRVWVHFSNGNRKWVKWDLVNPLRRSPNRLKRS